MSSLITELSTRTTRIRVESDRSGQARLHGEYGVIAARQVSADGADLEAALVATEATLLGGDDVRIEVTVGAGVSLTLRDIAATVAYAGHGRSASWSVVVTVEPGGWLAWVTQPFIVSDGADIERSLDIDLAEGAGLRLHDSVVLGRHGQAGGRLRCRTYVAYDGVPLLVEEVTYAGGPATPVSQAFVRGDSRRIDTDLVLGAALAEEATVAEGRRGVRHVEHPCDTRPLHRTTLDLAGPGQVIRTLS